MSRKTTANKLTIAGIIAAAYAVLTVVSALFGLSSGIIQIRISEALCVLPMFTSAAIPGLSIGCFIANLICGGGILDGVFGTLATFLAAVLTYFVSKIIRGKISERILVPLPNVLFNTAIIPWVLRFVYGEAGTIWYFALTVFAGEIISSFVLGIPLMITLEKHRNKIFR